MGPHPGDSTTAGAVRYAGGPPIEVEFYDIGLYDIYREPNTGLRNTREGRRLWEVPCSHTAEHRHHGSLMHDG